VAANRVRALGVGPDEFTAYLKSELRKWGEVVKMAHIRAE
jgi:hypothetical protein